MRLGDRADAAASSLPHGDQRKLEVAMLMALEPSVFMFDEPTAGMSIDDVPVILDLIRRLKSERDKTILLVEHKMDVVRELADRIVVLHNGQLVADGEPAAVIASPDRAASLSRPRAGSGAGMSAPPLLSLAGVHTHIGAYHILHGVDFEVPAGEVTMLLGRNGAGKTTTLRTIMGLWAASQGAVVFDGRRSAARRDARQRRAGAAADAGDRRARHRLRAREHGHLRRPHRRREHAARRALGAPPRPARHARASSGCSASSRR